VTPRIGRILRRTWWILIAGALVGAGTGTALAISRSHEVEPLYQGIASTVVTVPTAAANSKPTSVEISAALWSATNLAQEVNAEALAGRASITSNANDSTLSFRAAGSSFEEARALADAMRARYLTAIGLEVDSQLRLRSLLERAQAVQEQIDEMEREESEIEEIKKLAAIAALVNGSEDLDASNQAALQEGGTVSVTTPSATALLSKIDILKAQIGALNNRLGALTVDLTLEDDDDDREEIQQQMLVLGGVIAELQAELEQQSALLVVVTGEAVDQSSTSEKQAESSSSTATDDDPTDWHKAALVAQYEELQSEYESVFLQGQSGQSSLPPVVVSNITPEAMSVPLTSVQGLLAGLLAAAGLVLVHDRVRKPVWVAGDLDKVPVLAEVPLRPRQARSSAEPWYWLAAAGPRKHAIQRLQATLLGFIEGEPRSLGLTGMGTRTSSVRELAMDLAAAIVRAERSVLLIDADGLFAAEGWDSEQLSLAGLLEQTREEPETNVTRAKRALAESGELVPGLRVLPAGELSPEAILSRAFAVLLEEAKAEFDVTIVVAPDAGHPLTDTLSQRLDAMLVVARAGRTPAAELERLAGELADRSASLLGAVLLTSHGRSRRGAGTVRPGEVGRRFRNLSEDEPSPRESALMVGRQAAGRLSALGPWLRAWSRGRHRMPEAPHRVWGALLVASASEVLRSRTALLREHAAVPGGVPHSTE
jgi:hypothetical protein